MSNNDTTIPILVNDFEGTEIKGALPLPKEVFERTVDVSVGLLQKNLNKVVGGMLTTLEKTKLESENFQVDSVTFTLHIDSTGEVSLVSLAKGSLEGGMGLEFSIVRRKK